MLFSNTQCAVVFVLAVSSTHRMLADETPVRPPEAVADDLTPDVGSVLPGESLMGKTLRDKGGMVVGKTTDIIIDPYTASAVALVVEPAEETGRKRLLVPFSLIATLNDGNLSSTETAKVIESQPTSLLPKGSATPFARRMSIATFRHYDLEPYWLGEDGDSAKADRDDQFEFLTQLSKSDVKDARGKPLGRISDVVISRANGKVVYALFEHKHATASGEHEKNDDKAAIYFAIPLAAFVLPPVTHEWSLELPEQLLENTHAIQPADLPKEVSRAWVEYIHVRYGGGLFDGVQREKKQK